MLKIWGRANSTNVKKVLWAAEELGLAYERLEAGGVHGVVDTPEYRALNPNGLVPTIEDDGFVLWESNSIVRYLAAKHDSGGLYPTGLAERADAERWMDWTTSSIAAPFRDVFWNMVRTAPEKRDMAAVESGLKRCVPLFAIADAALARTPFVAGERLTMGDVPLGCFAYAWFNMAIDRPNLPNLAAWYQRLTERPAYKTAVMTPLR